MWLQKSVEVFAGRVVTGKNFLHEFVTDFFQRSDLSYEMLNPLCKSTKSLNHSSAIYKRFFQSTFRVVQSSLVAVQSLYEISNVSWVDDER